MKIIKEVKLGVCLDCAKNGVDYYDDDDECTHEKNTHKHVRILPGCCEASTRFGFPRVAVRFLTPESEFPIAYWYVPQGEYDHIWSRDEPYEIPPAVACPFCASKLPQIVASPNPPSPIASHDDCGHCGCGWPRSYGMCGCWPRVTMFDVESVNITGGT